MKMFPLKSDAAPVRTTLPTYNSCELNTANLVTDANHAFDAVLQTLKISSMEKGLTNSQRDAAYKEKFFSIMKKIKEIIECLSPQASSETLFDRCSDCKDLTNDIKNKYANFGKKERFQIVTCLPRTIGEMMSLLNISRCMGKKISKLRNDEGAFSFAEPKHRQGLPIETKNNVREIYLSSLYNKIMPGQWDTVYCDKDAEGNKQRGSKQLMLVTLTELYSEFVQQYPDNPISLSEFANLRPRQCRWVWNKGQHRNCTCIIHENFKLLLEGLFSSGTTQKTEELILTLLCEDAQGNCWLGLCDKCLNEEKLDGLLKLIEEIVAGKKLVERYAKATPIAGSRSSHAFIPSSKWPKMLLKQFSSAEKGVEFSIFEVEHLPMQIRPLPDQFV
ncbi:hypothetical protein Bhyg_08035 [Pseudolycoriella hygida]|uniref:Uncharacterized protein n=1 Tax=Pseudolycoriella hygida TaxID=35572 RepID=A0A9Q0S393_9DIPT|nr:hypothetical protein Bhyg_08035 [Pseudolycoriella hygida]